MSVPLKPPRCAPAQVARAAWPLPRGKEGQGDLITSQVVAHHRGTPILGLVRRQGREWEWERLKRPAPARRVAIWCEAKVYSPVSCVHSGREESQQAWLPVTRRSSQNRTFPTFQLAPASRGAGCSLQAGGLARSADGLAMSRLTVGGVRAEWGECKRMTRSVPGTI